MDENINECYLAYNDMVGNSMFTFSEIQGKLSGLHFAKEALSDGEREILYMAEALLAQIHKVNDIVHPRKPSKN